MGRVRVVRNDLPRIIRELPEAVDRAVDLTAESLERTIEATAWRDTGVVISTTRVKAAGRPMHAEVWVGVVNGPGFYVRFLEFGTSKMAARPRVVPAAHAHELVLVDMTTRQIRQVVT